MLTSGVRFVRELEVMYSERRQVIMPGTRGCSLDKVRCKEVV